MQGGGAFSERGMFENVLYRSEDEPWGAFSEFFGEQIPQENASMLHNDSLRDLVYNMNKYLTGARRLKFESCYMPTPVAAPEVVVLTTHGIELKRGIINFTPVTSCTPYGKEIIQVSII